MEALPAREVEESIHVQLPSVEAHRQHCKVKVLEEEGQIQGEVRVEVLQAACRPSWMGRNQPVLEAQRALVVAG